MIVVTNGSYRFPAPSYIILPLSKTLSFTPAYTLDRIAVHCLSVLYCYSCRGVAFVFSLLQTNVFCSHLYSISHSLLIILLVLTARVLRWTPPGADESLMEKSRQTILIRLRKLIERREWKTRKKKNHPRSPSFHRFDHKTISYSLTLQSPNCHFQHCCPG